MSKLYRGLMKSLNDLAATEYAKRTGKKDWKYVWTNFRISCQEVYYKYLVDWWRDPIYHCYTQTKSIIRWLPILWKDRNWDHWFILEILKHKIRFQREYITKHNRHTTAQEDGRNMRIAEFLIKRIQDDNYSEIPMKEHDAKWGELDWSFNGRNKDNVLMDNKFSKSGLTRTNIKSQKDWDQERKESSRIYDHARYMKSQDYDYLFKHLKKHLERWWD